MTRNYETQSRSKSSSMMTMAQSNPEALLVIAAGLALMMRSKTRQKSANIQKTGIARTGYYQNDSRRDGTLDRARDKAAQGMTAVESTMQNAMGSARQALASTSETASNYASATADTAREYLDSAKEYAGSAQEYVSDRMSNAWSTVSAGSDNVMEQVGVMADYTDQAFRSHPVATAALGMAIGATLATIIPSSRMEDEALADTREAIGEAARSAKDRLYDAADQAWHEARRLAEEKGVDAQGLKAMVNQVTDKFTKSATDSGSGPSGTPSSSATSPAASFQGQGL